jgi:hypothetical protein
MTQRLKDAIEVLHSLEGLPEEEQRSIAASVLDLVDSIQSRRAKTGDDDPVHPEANKPIWEVLGDLMKDIPDEELEQLPVDGAREHDHYLYGSPKRYS